MENREISRRDLANRLLFHAVCSPYMEQVIEAAHEIFDRPVLFLDEYFHLVNLAPEAETGIPLWDSIFRDKALLRVQKENLVRKIQENEAEIAFLEGAPFRGLLAQVLLDRRNRGYVLVFWEGDGPDDEDLTLMDMVLRAVKVRASTRTRTIGSWSISLSEKLKNLLEAGKDLPEETVITRGMESSLAPMYAVCVVPMGPLPAQRDFSQEAVQQLQQQLCLRYAAEYDCLRPGRGKPLSDVFGRCLEGHRLRFLPRRNTGHRLLCAGGCHRTGSPPRLACRSSADIAGCAAGHCRAAAGH